MSGATFVYASGRSLFLFPVGTIVYHYKGRHEFPRYVNGERIGEEHGYTRCGRTTEYTEQVPDLASKRNPTGHNHRMPMRAIRLDHAAVLGRLCVECERLGPKA